MSRGYFDSEFDYPFGRPQGRYADSELASSLGDLRRPSPRGPLPPPPGFGSNGQRLAPWSTLGDKRYAKDRMAPKTNNDQPPSKSQGGAEGTKTHKREIPLKERLKRGFEVFAQSTSIQGIAFAQAAPRGIRQFIWTTIFVVFFGATMYQIIDITKEFLKYPVQTKLLIKDGVVSYPSVSICNLNIVRDSQVDLNQALRDFIDEENLDVEYNMYETPVDDGANESSYSFYNYNYGSSEEYSGDFFQGTTDESFAQTTRFKKIVGEVDVDTRQKMGHQIELMLNKCVFNGKVCFSDNFTHSTSGDYGNCYTFNSAYSRNSALKTRFLGPEYGLSLQLFKENIEYLESLTPGSGWRLVVHPFDTLPYPLVSGISLAPGMETFVGMTYNNITRPGKPYEACEEGTAFVDEYDAQYTLQACQTVCASRRVLLICKCYLPEKIENYPLGTSENGTVCDTEGRKCASQETGKIVSGQVDCNCVKPCKETNILQEVSMNAWPDVGLLRQLTKTVCNVAEEFGNTIECATMEELVENGTREDREFYLRDNFGAVNVFFKTLTTNIVIEEPAYTFTRFGSDIGGTVGLWLGLSVFSFIEIFNFVGHMLKYVHYSCTGNRPKPDRFQRPPSRYNQSWQHNDTPMPNGNYNEGWYPTPYR